MLQVVLLDALNIWSAVLAPQQALLSSLQVLIKQLLNKIPAMIP